mmetsp:Transcript_21006/g.46060  ORF Transcript_21006/g.46060 Transcript_21006/m.46060 type:complete len:374 (-) Transcript_21006:249-1370(-)
MQHADANLLTSTIDKLHKIRKHAIQLPDKLALIALPPERAELANDVKALNKLVSTLQTEWPAVQAAAQRGRQVAQATPVQSSSTEHDGSAQVPVPSTSGFNAGAAADMFEGDIVLHMITSMARASKRQRLEPQKLTSRRTSGGVGAGTLPPGPGPTELQALVDRVRAAAPGLMLFPCSASGLINVAAKDAAELRFAYRHVLCGSIALAAPGHPEAVRVVLDSYDRAHEIDAWTVSQQQLFRRLSSLSARALSYFQKRQACLMSSCLDATCPVPGAEAAALEDLLLWIAGYRDLFTRPCCMTGTLLAWDPSTHFPLPPIFRPFNLSRRQLLQAASDPSHIRAYHMHIVPDELLRWSEGEVDFKLDGDRPFGCDE